MLIILLLPKIGPHIRGIGERHKPIKPIGYLAKKSSGNVFMYS